MTAAYQFLCPQEIILPRPESFKVGHFKAYIKVKLNYTYFEVERNKGLV